MLGVLLTLLKIIGIILLAVLCILLAIVIIVLFVPIRYNAKGSYSPIELKASVSYLLHFISFKVHYDEAFKYSLRILGIKIFSNDKKTKTVSKNKESKHPITTDDTKSAAIDNKKVTETKNNNIEAVTQDKVQADSSNPDIDRNTEHNDSSKEKENENSGSFVDSLKDIKDNIEYYKNLLEKPSTQAAIALCKERIGLALKAILPRRGSINLEIGLENAGYTGKIMGAYYSLYSYIGRVVEITPHYDEQIIKVDFYLRGHIRIATLLYQLIRIYFDRNCHRLIKLFMKKAKAGKDK